MKVRRKDDWNWELEERFFEEMFRANVERAAQRSQETKRAVLRNGAHHVLRLPSTCIDYIGNQIVPAVPV